MLGAAVLVGPPVVVVAARTLRPRVELSFLQDNVHGIDEERNRFSLRVVTQALVENRLNFFVGTGLLQEYLTRSLLNDRKTSILDNGEE